MIAVAALSRSAATTDLFVEFGAATKSQSLAAVPRGYRPKPSGSLFIKAMTTKLEIPEGWTATPDNVNGLPAPLRRYIHDLQRTMDHAGLMRENFALRQKNADLRRESERLAAQLRTKT